MTVTIKRVSAKSARPRAAVTISPSRRSAPAPEIQLFDFAMVFQAAPMDRLETIKRGVRAGEVIKLAALMDTSQDRLMKRLGLPRATVVRKTKAHQNLSTEQGERVVGLSKLVGQVQTIVNESGNPEGFDAKEWLDDWLTRPLPALGGDCADNWLDTADRRAVIFNILACTQSGAYL